MDRDLGILANTLTDMYRGSVSCSSLIVSPKRSATGGPLFGRNLDFYTLGLLDKYSLVTIHRPKGKHAFAAVGFPGLFGCLSGMNDAGLALAVHEVILSHDSAPMFNPKGMPYTFCFRQMLEQCATIEQAEQLLRTTPRTTLLSLAVVRPAQWSRIVRASAGSKGIGHALGIEHQRRIMGGERSWTARASPASFMPVRRPNNPGKRQTRSLASPSAGRP